MMTITDDYIPSSNEWHNETLTALLDVRDSTFKMNYYLDEMYSYDNDPFAYVNLQEYDADLNCVYITPNLLSTFELIGETDFYVLHRKV